ncbi:MAG: glutamate-1-semialdehyde 2,1-aminomutase, partial [Deltaproteobacteria bacterium]|nr:glutamate-1-semialdehyde 2,1-aminomutase [Deltaproteobacteria bacterium]
MSDRYKNSKKAFEMAARLMPGGVNSPVRALKSVGGTPFFASKGRGAYIYDIDGNEYIDYVLSWGPLILGHCHEEVIDAVMNAAFQGFSFGAPTEREAVLCEMIREAFPSVEMARLVSSGTEAVMSAIRVARGFTGRDKIVKFAGCYHGHADYLLVKAGSGAMTFGTPDSKGVPEDFARLTATLPYNDIEAVRQLFSAEGDRIAAVIVEPVVGNMGTILPREGFLETLRELCTAHGAVLIFDEVMTGFRVAYGGAQELFGIKPDMTALGKVIGGGLPVGAYGGKREIMENVSPLGAVYQAGTLSGNPLSVSAGIAALTVLKREMPYQYLENKTKKLCAGLEETAKKKGIAARTNSCGSMWTP